MLVFIMYITSAVNFDFLTAQLWQCIRQQDWSRQALAEANVAAGSFFVWIALFRALDTLPLIKQFRFVQRPPVPPFTFWYESAAALRNIWSLDHKQWRLLRVWASLPVYLGAIALIHCVKKLKPLDPQAPTFARLVGEVVLGIWAYDFIFYWLHLAMHKFPNLPHGHSVHHEMVESTGRPQLQFLEAEAVVNHSLLDGALQVTVNIFVQNLPLLWVPKHKLSRLIHNVVVTYLLVEAHAGLDLPWATHKVFPTIFGGAARHELHHQLHKCCYHQFFKYLDDILGYSPPKKLEHVTKYM